jgi:hypothetical protein
MEFNAVALPGDTLAPMARTFVEEFMLMGYDDEQLLQMFRTPAYQAPFMVWREMGEAWVKELIRSVREGVPMLRARVIEPRRSFEV